VPGVRDVAITDKPPREGFANGALFLIEGRENLPYSQRPSCGFKVVGPSYFDTAGMRVALSESSDTAAQRVNRPKAACPASTLLLSQRKCVSLSVGNQDN
jgi:hypothetical protein